MAITHSHKLVLPADANHHGTLYAGARLRLVLEAAYATAWKHVGPQANLVLRRVLNMECLRPVPVGVVVELQGVVLRRTAAYLVCGLVGMPWDNEGPWVEALCEVIADNAGLLVAGHDSSFQNKVHLARLARGFLDNGDNGAANGGD